MILKKTLSDRSAVAIIVLFAVAILFVGARWVGARAGVLRDVRPLVKEMNAGKPATEPLSREEAQGDALMMGSQGKTKPSASGKPAKTEKKP